MKNNRLQFLLQLLVDNKINERELEELASLMQQPENDEIIDAQLKNTWENLSSSEKLNDTLYHQITSHQRFTQSIVEEERNSKWGSLRNKWYYVAATILLSFGIGMSIYLFSNLKKTQVQLANRVTPTAPTNDHVMLTLSSGKKVALEELALGKIVTEGNIGITKNKEGQLVYDLSSINDDGTLDYNTISTPVGSNYQVILSDGTKVWLNAKTTLKFPAVFKGTNRQVELSGEAYFEVAHNEKQPFLLTAKGMTVQVLGTHFNVSAYDDDQLVKTSLLEGAIKANYQTKSLLLKPGQQAVLSESKLSQSGFNEDDVMAWKSGYFIFRNEPIQEIMKEISRWYHIEVAYQGNLTKEEFGGKYLKNSSLKELLSSLELTGKVKFKMEGRRVTVMQ
ncbi:FecR family protein [Nubsella zeaxanthinifaciens]|uniref:FecR family protein n=1 Tax=Nubsella zeaxanthinifaciens TaxID=392412 RepID=UPI000DE25F96|nr:FecR family protein [Nubsella zeaxanthinifaciens]